MGVPVYGKFGFEGVGRLEIPLEEFGGKGEHVHSELISCLGRLSQSNEGGENAGG
jgi:hypothetical protein